MTTQTNSTKIRRLPVFEEEKELSKFLETNFTESLKNMIKLTVKTMVKSEMESFRKEVSDKLYFNGTYGRNMTSTFGRIDDVPIPRFRQSPEGMETKALSVFDEEQHKFMKLVEQMHLLGISQRKIKRLANTCFGIPISVDRVGAIYRELVEKEDININQKPLDDDFAYLLLDGIWEKTKGYGWDDNQTVLLCALGIRPSGERKILGFSLTRKEETKSWNILVKQLKSRGLAGANLKLVIADDHPTIKAACEKIYPDVLLQNCVVHKMRSVIRKTNYKNRPGVIADLKGIFSSETKDEAMEKAKATVKKWYMTEPRAMESLRFNIEYCFTYFSFPKDLWSKVRTTNILEREFREVRRRMKVFDNTFQNERSANKYANSIFSYLNSNYPLKGGLHTKA
jgi:putative transposase